MPIVPKPAFPQQQYDGGCLAITLGFKQGVQGEHRGNRPCLKKGIKTTCLLGAFPCFIFRMSTLWTLPSHPSNVVISSTRYFCNVGIQFFRPSNPCLRSSDMHVKGRELRITKWSRHPLKAFAHRIYRGTTRFLIDTTF